MCLGNTTKAKLLLLCYTVGYFITKKCNKVLYLAILRLLKNIERKIFQNESVKFLKHIIQIGLKCTLLLFKKFSSEKGILAGQGLEPTSPCSREEIAEALDHSATMTC